MTAVPQLRSKPYGGSVDAGALDAALAARVEPECRAQGVPVGLDDAIAINAILSLLKDWTATDPDPSYGATGARNDLKGRHGPVRPASRAIDLPHSSSTTTTVHPGEVAKRVPLSLNRATLVVSLGARGYPGMELRADRPYCPWSLVTAAGQSTTPCSSLNGPCWARLPTHRRGWR